MATITKTYTENLNYDDDPVASAYKSTWTVTVTGTNATASQSTVTISTPTLTAKYVNANKNRGGVDIGHDLYFGSTCIASAIQYTKGEFFDGFVSMTSGTAYNIPLNNTPSTFVVQTSTLFNSSNPNDKTVNIVSKEFGGMLGSTKSGTNYEAHFGWKDVDWTTLGTILTVTLNAPPTFSNGDISFTTHGATTTYAYAGFTTASVSVSSLSAKYGGSIATDGVVFTIGSQTAKRSSNGTLSIALNQAGTFTPTIKVTDSRGQVTTKSLPSITVLPYITPSVSFNGERTDSVGKPEDEGTYIVINPTFTFTEDIVTLSAPAVQVTDQNNTSVTVTTTWYSTRASDGTLSGSVTWGNLSSGDTVYGLISTTGGFNTQYSFQVSITPEDSEYPGTTQTQTVGSAFYTVDFLAGGHGIAFGQPASQVGFFCNMDAYFKDKANQMRALFDFFYPIGSYYETSDATFDPNVTWGGTWSLETAGQVHVSAGTGYAVAGALTNTSDGGEPTHVLTTNEMPSHTHAQNRHRHDRGGNYATSSTSGSTRVYVATANQKTPSASYTEFETPTNQNTGGGLAHNNMQPYIVVCRWHRTA